jgi:hypothetical protein
MKVAVRTAVVFALTWSSAAFAQSSRYEELGNFPFTRDFLSTQAIATLTDEMTFQRTTQAYLWRFPRSIGTG